MTPAAIYKAVRDFLVVAAIAFVVYRVYTDGKNSEIAGQVKTLQAQVEQQSIILQKWHLEATDANTELAASIGRINSAPVVVHDWVQSQPSCTRREVLPAAAGAPGNGAGSGRGDQPVGGTAAGDARMRDTALADWKRYWESRLAPWRTEHAQWPQP